MGVYFLERMCALYGPFPQKSPAQVAFVDDCE